MFVDSRVDIFEYEGVFKDYIDLLALHNVDNIVGKYHIKYILFPPGEVLTSALLRDSSWKVIYSDEVSVLLERVGPSRTHQPGCRKHRKAPLTGRTRIQVRIRYQVTSGAGPSST